MGTLTVVDGMVDGVDTPLSLDRGAPRFSWRLTSDERGARQGAYRIVVATSADAAAAGAGGVADTGVVASSRTVDIVVPGLALEPRTRYFWAVRVRDAADAESSGPVWRFETGIRGTENWHARWIGAPVTDETAPDSPAAHVLAVRREFEVSGGIRRARLRSTALGLHDVRINGAPVSPDRFTPTWTDYRRRVRYRTWDVTALLADGPNAIGALLAPGYYAGWLPAPVGRERYYGSQPWWSAELEIEHLDGTLTAVRTDESWQCAPSWITTAEVYHGEERDARLAMSGWDGPGFDASGWAGVAVDDTALGTAELDGQDSAAVRVAGERAPESITEPVPGTYVVDFGQNLAGWVRLEARGAAGETITLRHGEVLDADGTVYTRNLRAARATDRFTLAGAGGPEVFEPLFTYHGFRYLEITGYPGRPAGDAIRAIVAHADLPPALELRTSDPLLDDLQRALSWTLDNDLWSYPTDCHQRDERLPWISMDMVGFAPTMVLQASGEAYYRDWLRTVADAQLPSGGFPDIAVGIELGEAAPGASELLIVLAHALWREYGTTGAIDDCWEAIRRYLAYAEACAPDGLTTRPGWVDWIAAGEETDRGVVGQAFHARAFRLASELAAATGRAEAARYADLADLAGRRFVEHYVDAEGRVRGDSQTAYVLALAFGLVPDAARPVLAAHLVANIRSRGMHLSTGFIGTHDLLSVLSDTGHADVAAAVIRQTSYPSWGYMIERGATTLWERWDSIHPDGSFAENDPPIAEMNSFNHYGYGGFGRWLVEAVGGLSADPGSPGYDRFTLAPDPATGIASAELRRRTPHGTIVCAWRRDEHGFHLHAEVPVNTTATIRLPDGDTRAVGSGVYDLTQPIAEP